MSTATNRADTRGQRKTNEDARDFIHTEIFGGNPFDVNKLPKIDGFVYKWVTTSAMGQAYAQNVQRAITERWKPVLLSDLKTAAEKANSDVSFLLATEWQGQTGVVGSHDMILMMRPESIHNAHKDYIRQQVDGQEMAVGQQFSNAMPEGFKKMRVADIDDD
jgi:hypothetical protein